MRKSARAGLGFLLAGGTVWAQYLISTVAGGGAPFTPAPALSAGLLQPTGAAADALGNVYFCSGNSVFRADPSGVLTRIAGIGTAGYSGDSNRALAGPSAPDAQLNSPEAVAVDGSGNVYIADTGNNAIRMVTAAGLITTIAGGPAAAVALNSPEGVAADSAGNVYISDSKNSVVRELTAAGALVTVAGSGTPGFYGDSGPATAAQLTMPAGLAVDAAGNLYIADLGNSAIRKVTAGTITTVAGVGGSPGYWGDGVAATLAQLSAPASVAVDAAGNLYIADTANNVIRKVGLNGIISAFAGTGVGGFAGDGAAAANARLGAPWGVAVDGAGDVLIADTNNYRIREVTGGTINTVAGSGVVGYHGDGGPATSDQLAHATGVAVDSSGNFYIADTLGNQVFEVTPNGTITTVAGTGVKGYSGDTALATAAQLDQPHGVALDSSGNIYIADTGNHAVREVTVATGIITTIAGNGTPGYSGNGLVGTSAQLNSPWAVAVDSSSNVYIADFGNNVIREVETGDIIGTIAGSFNAGYYGDGTAATGALLNSPTGVAVDSSSNVYIADSYNNVIRKVSISNGFISTVAGTGVRGYSGNGAAATSATLFQPQGVTLDSSGNIFIADTGNNVIREVTSNGNIGTVIGDNVAGYLGDGGSATSAELNGPTGMAVDSSGNVYVADANNSVIRLAGAPSRAILSVTATHSGTFEAGQTGAAYSVVVSNGAGAGATSGVVTVTATPSSGVTLASMSGTGWTCSGSSCTRGDALAGGSSYPAIAVTVNLAGPISQAVLQVAVSGGGSAGASATDSAILVGAPLAPVLISPPNGDIAVSTAPILSWGTNGASSYTVFFGTTNPPPQVTTTTATTYAPGTLNLSTTYYWQVEALNSAGTAASAVSSFTTLARLNFVPVAPCRAVDTRRAAGPLGGPTLAAGTARSFALQGACGIPATAQAYSLNVTAVPQGPMPFLTLWPAGQPQPFVSTLNAGGGAVAANAAIVPAGAGGAVSVFVNGTSDVILDVNGYFEPTGGSSFYAVPPCRVADTRQPDGPLGGPSIDAGGSRDFPIPTSPCGIPTSATAYSLNVTAVPDPGDGFLSYLTTWATGQPQPPVSTLNSADGSVVANAAIVPAGTGGSVSVYVTNLSDVVLDTNGYFAAAGGTGALSFYPVAPCRAADTRTGEMLEPNTPQSFPIVGSGCNIPATAQAYSLNITAVPQGPLSYLAAWPTGLAQPLVSTLNAPDGNVQANAAIVPAGTGGAISVAVTNPSHVVIDINGYFAP